MRTIKVVCRRNGAETGLFLDGKIYEAVQRDEWEEIGSHLFAVRDEQGHERYIIPDQPDPHLKSFKQERSVGVFETVQS